MSEAARIIIAVRKDGDKYFLLSKMRESTNRASNSVIIAGLTR